MQHRLAAHATLQRPSHAYHFTRCLYVPFVHAASRQANLIKDGARPEFVVGVPVGVDPLPYIRAEVVGQSESRLGMRRG